MTILITPEQIEAVGVPEVNTVIAEGPTNFNYVVVSRLPSGDYQANVLQPNGKEYVIIFPEITEGGGGYVSYETP